MTKLMTCLLFLIALPPSLSAQDRYDRVPHTAAAGAHAAAVPTFPRVRAISSAMAEAIAHASERSATFKHLVATINGTDGIVYVHEGVCGHQVRACLLMMVTAAGNNRILHIKVDTRKKGTELLASIGHELRHAIEVLREPTIVDGLGAYHLFDRIGPTGKDRFETDAAIQTGLDVHAEVQHSLKHGRGRF